MLPNLSPRMTTLKAYALATQTICDLRASGTSMLCNIILCYTIPYCTILYYTIPYHTIPYHTIPYHTILYYTILYYTILYYIKSYDKVYHIQICCNALSDMILHYVT